MPTVTILKTIAPKDPTWKPSFFVKREDGATSFMSWADVGKQEHPDGSIIAVSDMTLNVKMTKDQASGALKPVPREWKLEDGNVVKKEAAPDPMQNTGTPYKLSEQAINTLIAPTVQYERSPDLYKMTLDELIAERNNAITAKANPAYIGQLDNLIIDEQHHQKLMATLDLMCSILQRLEAGK